MSQDTTSLPAFLLLEDGTFFKGKSFGKTGTTGGGVMLYYRNDGIPGNFYGSQLYRGRC